MTLVVIPAGLIADAFGRKRVLLAGLGLMTLTSVGCALAGVVMLASAQFVGLSALAITGGAALALLSIGVLDPLTKGLAMGVFSRNIGLITGLISTFCYGSIALAMALMAWLPERSQAPLGWFYVAAAAGLVTLLATTVKHKSLAGAAARLMSSQVRHQPTHGSLFC